VGIASLAVPENGRPVPDGAMVAKLEWSKKSNDASPYAVTVPDTLKSASFTVKGRAAVQGVGRVGLRPVQVRQRGEDVRFGGDRHGLRLCVPHARQGTGLRLHQLSATL